MPLKRVVPMRVDQSPTQASFDARQVAEVLMCAAVGDLVTYLDIEELTGVNLRERRHLLETVRGLLYQRDHRVLKVVPGVGLRSLTALGKVEEAEERTKSTFRRTDKTLMILAAVDMRQLTPLDTHRYLVQQALSGTVKWLSSARTQEQILEDGRMPVLDLGAHARVKELW
jgi:hypothetical protein